MILSDKSIRRMGLVNPCESPAKFRGKSCGLSCAGYDVRVDLKDPRDSVFDPACGTVMTPDGDGILLKPGQSTLVGIVEHFNLPGHVMGIVHSKSTWSRQGLFTASAVLEPGWRGYLSLRIVNHGSEDLIIVDREPIAQVVFHLLDGVPERTYSGKYQGQQRGPQDARF